MFMWPWSFYYYLITVILLYEENVIAYLKRIMPFVDF